MYKPDILLVDDDPDTIRILSKILSDQASVRFALSGGDALRIARQHPPDIVLLDAEMPGQDGFSVCKAMRGDAILQETPVIFVTSHQDANTEYMALELGAADFITKPIAAAQLIARVRTQLRHKRLIGELERLATYIPSMSAGRRDKRILIVDDDTLAIQALHRTLADTGASFSFATSAEEALRMAHEHVPDVMLLDLQLPGVDGLALCEQWQAHAVLRFVPIVVVTRYTDHEVEAQALAAGATDFISKPYSPTVLKARVRNILRLKAQTDAALSAERAHWQRLEDSRVSQIVSAVSDAIISTDVHGDIVLINQAACTLFEVKPSFMIGQPINRWLPPGWDAVNLPADPPPDAHRPRTRLIATRASRERFPVEISVSATGTGKERLTTVMLRDLTRQEEAERAHEARVRAESTSRTKSLMLSYIAHEIGNPLNGILGMAELMQTDDARPLGDVQAARLAHLVAASQHLHKLMHDVIDINRFEVGKFEVKCEALDAADAVREALSTARGQAAASAVPIEFHPPAAPIRVVADSLRLRQCLVNLLSNALKYGGNEGPVRVHLALTDGTVQLSVTDCGPGLSEAQIASLFEPFNRLGRTDRRGSGIGLALTRQLVEAMNGRIDAHAVEPRGTRFTIHLPAGAAP